MPNDQFGSWNQRFESALAEFRAENIIRKWEKKGVPPTWVRHLLWIYSCAPSQPDMQAALLASDQDIERLVNRSRNVAQEIRKFNTRAITSGFLRGLAQIDLPNYSVSGGQARDLPQSFARLPDVLEAYSHAVRALSELVNRKTADRRLVRGRTLALLCISLTFACGTPPYREIATIIEVGAWAATGVEVAISERSLTVGFNRFKANHRQEYDALERLLRRPSLDPQAQTVLLALHLLSKNLLKLPPAS